MYYMKHVADQKAVRPLNPHTRTHTRTHGGGEKLSCLYIQGNGHFKTKYLL